MPYLFRIEMSPRALQGLMSNPYNMDEIIGRYNIMAHGVKPEHKLITFDASTGVVEFVTHDENLSRPIIARLPSGFVTSRSIYDLRRFQYDSNRSEQSRKIIEERYKYSKQMAKGRYALFNKMKNGEVIEANIPRAEVQRRFKLHVDKLPKEQGIGHMIAVGAIRESFAKIYKRVGE